MWNAKHNNDAYGGLQQNDKLDLFGWIEINQSETVEETIKNGQNRSPFINLQFCAKFDTNFKFVISFKNDQNIKIEEKLN